MELDRALARTAFHSIEAGASSCGSTRQPWLRTPRDEPKLSEVFGAYILARNAGVEEDFVDQLFNSSEKSLASVLLLVANFVKEGKPEPAIPKFSQETLAEIVGAHAVTRERVHQSISGVGLINDKYTTSLLNVILHDRRPDGRGIDGK